MLKIIRLASGESHCFLTGSTQNVVEVKFDNKCFAGTISWDALLEVLKKQTGTEAAKIPSGNNSIPNDK